ncbi:hypothetical protein VTO73DRAFT_12458 [Trametes versicolor]
MDIYHFLFASSPYWHVCRPPCTPLLLDTTTTTTFPAHLHTPLPPISRHLPLDLSRRRTCILHLPYPFRPSHRKHGPNVPSPPA